MRDVNSFNKVILIGRLGQNPEVRYIPQSDNRAVANFSLATNERTFNPSTGQGDIRTEWHRVVVWGKLAEFCEKYLTKGKQILIEGRLRTEKWQDREGNQRSTTKVNAYAITLLGKRDEGYDSGGGLQDDFQDQPSGGGPSPFPKTNTGAIPDIQPDDDDDVPF